MQHRKRKRSLSNELHEAATTIESPESAASSTAQESTDSDDDDGSDFNEFEEISAGDITIAIFCALPYEAVAVKYSLDEETTCRPEASGPNNYVYSFGRIGNHKIVIVRPHQIGTVKAAQCATTVSQQFPNVRFALLVGIGAGIPNLPTRDIRLGDVAISIPRGNHPGVIQYDFGKYEKDGFVLGGSLNKPPPILISADGSLEEDEMMNRSQLRKILKAIIKRSGFERPNTSDILFDPDFHHVNKEGDCSGCEVSRKKKLVSRTLRRDKHPVVHRGLILSGSGVVKNPSDREQLSRGYYADAICYEMEAAGIMDEIPCLVIRGICDYADTHKQDGWHHYAAAVAAAYCKAILLKVNYQDVEETSSMQYVLSEMARGFQENQSIIQGAVDTIGQKIDLAALPVAEGASFGGFVDQYEEECLPGTRVELLQHISHWTDDPHGKCIFWLNGMAGTGKSTISRTVARLLQEKGSLGASFFFKRGEGDRQNASRLIPTITRQLVVSIPQLMPGVSKTIKEDPDISKRHLREQFDRLLLQPVLGLNEYRSATMVILIDALDECEREDDIKLILQLLPQLKMSKSPRLRFFLTSRPELPIRVGFSDISEDHQDLVLHEIPKSVVEHDISLYFADQFSKIRQRRSLPPDWPGDETIKALIERAVPLFISAATLCRFIRDEKWNPKKRLENILADKATYTSKMDRIYMPVLNQLLTGQDEWETQQLAQEFKKIIGVIILLAAPLSVNALSRFLDIEPEDVNIRLDLLYSVLDVPNSLDQPVRLLHLSFRDFLLNSRIKDMSPFWIDQKEVHHKLTIRCLDTMRRHLRKNICCLPGDGTQRTEIDVHSINQYLPPELQYTCRYWAHHLKQNENPFNELNNVFLFLEKHFLHWVEAMSILGILSEVVEIINTLLSLIQGGVNLEISGFLHDARRFILKNRQIVDASPLQLYASGLVFAPRKSIIRKKFIKELPSWICRLPKVQESWHAELQTLEGHGAVTSVAFSPDGQLLASGSSDKTVKVWDATTGALLQTLESHSAKISSVAFSQNGQLLASGSYDKTIKLWNIATGALQQTFDSHSDIINSIAISRDNRLLVSGSDKTIVVWDISIGAPQQTLESHSAPVLSVAYSWDNQLLASGSHDRTVKLWNITTGALLQTFEGHSDRVVSVAFSPNNQLLISGSGDRTIRLWNITMGVLQQTFEGHLSSVTSVAISWDGQLLASCSNDRTIKLWNVTTGALQQTLEDHLDSVTSVAFSWNGILASGSVDKTIKVWDTTTKTLQDFEGHSAIVSLMKFSQDGRLLASSSYDRAIKLWDTATGNLHTLEGHSALVASVAFSPDSRLMVSGFHDSTVRLWDTATRTLRTLEGHSASVEPVVFSPDGRLLASGSHDTTVKIWDTFTGVLKRTLEGHSDWISSIVFSQDGQLLASGSHDSTVKLWQTAITPTTTTATRALQSLEGHSDSIESMAFSPNGQLLASGSYDDTIKLWDTYTGVLQRTLKGHFACITSVAFSHNSKLLISGSIDKTVRLWDTATGALQHTLSIEGVVTHLNFLENNPSCVHTNLGSLKIQPWDDDDNYYTFDSPKTMNVELFIPGDQWIYFQGKKMLWLPPEYRPFSSAFKNGAFALGLISGRVAFITVGT